MAVVEVAAEVVAEVAVSEADIGAVVVVISVADIEVVLSDEAEEVLGTLLAQAVNRVAASAMVIQFLMFIEHTLGIIYRLKIGRSGVIFGTVHLY